ncbi:MAG: multicopper oxidase domain-containing protein [Bdellovibrionaceae bacterium]|nr:multicopper oxidase domain-containing protein [Pseudobdellovibrionaceae bacterium]
MAKITAVSAVLPKKLLQAAEKPLFTNPYHLPPLLLGKKEGKKVSFHLNIQSGLSSILRSKKTKTWGINQAFLGVTLKVNKGDQVHVTVKNSLTETTTLHWHGMKLPAHADGGPHQPIAPLKEWKTHWNIIQPAATLWYHAHTSHKTGQQVYNGLAGMLLIDDKDSQKLNLPSEYGVDDFPIMLLDRSFNTDGSLEYIKSMHDRMRGKMGTHILINGVHKPVLKVKKSLIRLRLLNASNARFYRLQFKDNRIFNIIASDGGLLEKPIASNSILLSPGERAEIIVEVFQGSLPTLIYRVQGRNGLNHDYELLQINTQKVTQSKKTLPSKLVTHKKENEKKATTHRRMQLQMQRPAFRGDSIFKINNKAMDMKRIDEVVTAGSLEVWSIENQSSMPHPFHIHNVQFKIISKSGSEVYGHERGFKDTVLVRPKETIKVLIRFPKYTDEKYPYMYHCHILEHEDQGMMGQFIQIASK